MPDLTARITEILTRNFGFGSDLCAPIAESIVGEFRREERQIDYGLGSLGVEKRTQVRYVTPWETQ